MIGLIMKSAKWLMQRWRLWLMIILVIVLYLVIQHCQGPRNKPVSFISEAEYNRMKHSYELQHTLDSQEISRQDAVLLIKDRDLKELLDVNSKLKRPISIINTTIGTSIVHDTFLLHDTIRDPNMIRVPVKFHKKTRWYAYSGAVTKKAVQLDTFSVSNDLQVNVGYKRPIKFGEYFKRPQLISEVVSNNPYSHINSVQTFVKNPTPKWYQRKSTFFGIGLGIGIFTSLIIFK